MKRYLESDNGLKWKTVLAALLVSLLIHQAVFFAMDLMGMFKKDEPENKMKVTLLNEKPKPKPKKDVGEKKKEETPKKPLKKSEPLKKPTKKVAKKPEPLQKPVPQPMTPPPPVMPEEPVVSTAPEPKPPTPQKLNTKLNWGAFERTMGQNAAQERVAYEDKLLEKRGGGFKFGKMTAKVQKALVTHKSWVAGAPQEPVGTKSITFKQYLDATHEMIHKLFADSFLPSLVRLGAGNPLNDFSLMTLVEFQILENGVINEVRVIKTSGLAVFDAGAVDSLYRASPFIPPPKTILSYDNKVYFRWGFYRNQRKCGTFNATGYILTAPSAAPVPISDGTVNSIIDG
jgi:TonB family protein